MVPREKECKEDVMPIETMKSQTVAGGIWMKYVEVQVKEAQL
jgi:hypothetical protein